MTTNTTLRNVAEQQGTMDQKALSAAADAFLAANGANKTVGYKELSAAIAAYAAASPHPANPAQVTDAEVRRYIDKCNELAANGEYTWWSRLAEILAAIGAGGQAVACKECDGTGFKDKNGARLTLARTPCGACAGSGYVAALSQPHPADERVVEVLRKAANIAFDEMFAVTGAPVARAVQQKILALSTKEGQ